MIDETTRETTPRVIAGRYELRSELGRGGMGVVWRAEDRVIGRQVAIKELRLSGDAQDAGVFQERVLREVRTGGRLNDPAVVGVYDVITEDDATFIVMELVSARTLSELIKTDGPLPPAKVASIGRQVLSALRAAHAAGVVHRDVKPGNIMVDANGRVKLTDFGIAQAVDDPRLTTSGMLVGSPAFMAPERVAGQAARPESDLWALGATLFFAVEGMVAFERPTTAATLHAIMSEVPYLTRASGPLASAITGLLIANPDGRLSADKAAELLALADVDTLPGRTVALQGGAPLRTTVDSRPAVPGRDPARRRNLLLGGAIGAVVLLAGAFFAGAWWGSRPAPGDPNVLPTLTAGKGGQIPVLESGSFGTSNYGDSGHGNYACLNTRVADGTAVISSNWVKCEDWHAAEYIGGGRPVGGSSSDEAITAQYPGEQRLAKAAEGTCEAIFYSDMVQSAKRPSIQLRAVIPAKEAWEKDKARWSWCFVTQRDGSPAQGSVQNLKVK